jgi:hypothetical protein
MHPATGNSILKISSIMKKFIFLICLAILTACTSTQTKKEAVSSAAFIDETTVKAIVDTIKAEQPAADMYMLEKGVKHAASIWRKDDGAISDFAEFVKKSYISDPVKRKVVFLKICRYAESLNGNFNEITLDLRKTLDEPAGNIDEIDRMFGNYSPGSHMQDDFYANKIAFFIGLNFPCFTLDEKEKLGPKWNRDEWEMARLGDLFIARVPAGLDQAVNEATGNSEMYIAEYNIYMGHLRTDDGRQIFPDGMVLLSHWNLRDELKADYAEKVNGQEKQEMVYKVMERIITQEIPKVVINSPDYDWAPFSNKVTKGGKAIEVSAEPDTRYSHIISNFRTRKKTDAFYPEMDSYILRKFSLEMEIAQDEVESLFDSYLSSPQLIKLGSMVKERLRRDLRPYDIWYDGFKTRSSIPESLLTSKTSALFADPAAFHAAMPVMLKKLGWSEKRAAYISEKIVVDPARGSGHAWGAAKKGSLSHLRTRISEKGMDYKGYNIAVHEFGHNVEQTISMYDVDNYMMARVPNTAITEALAFVFQSRDLFLLGMKDENPDKEKSETFDAAWSLMEIMGVGMVDMKVWKWLYANPDATPAQLKAGTISIALDVWNKYFAPVLGVKESPVLAIYSHMIDAPLYLANYSYGHVIQFQMEEYLKGKNFSTEIDRIYSQGNLTPQQWMMGAVGTKISTQPILNALDKALK